MSRPLLIALAVAVTGVVAMLLVNHGPASKPQSQSGASDTATKAAAESAGATVTPTESKLALEPDPPGPKPVQPANPVTAN
jgi:hypothetical protein